MTMMHKGFSNVDFLLPLVQGMTAVDPNERPEAESALESWQKIRGGVCFVRRGARLRPTESVGREPILFGVTTFLELGILLSRRIFMWVTHLPTRFGRHR